MTSREFNIDNRTIARRLPSLLQHKLRVVMKCYTITGFVLNEDNTFVFRKSHMINGVRLNDSKVYTGSFEIQPGAPKSTLKINIHSSIQA